MVDNSSIFSDFTLKIFSGFFKKGGRECTIFLALQNNEISLDLISRNGLLCFSKFVRKLPAQNLFAAKNTTKLAQNNQIVSNHFCEGWFPGDMDLFIQKICDTLHYSVPKFGKIIFEIFSLD